MTHSATVIGAGLAGSEAAWQLAKRGIQVHLYEMRPERPSEVHQTPNFAELVCSNSLRSDQPEVPVGQLKREMEAWDSLIIRCARKAALPAGGALAVDRERFSQLVTHELEQHSLIQVHREEWKSFPEHPSVLAPGPLCSPELHQAIYNFLGDEALYFYDAIAPVVELDSLDLDVMYFKSRYDKGEGQDYLNLALDQEQYETFHQNICDAEKVVPKSHEKMIYFEGCLPVEVMASRGVDTLRFGPMKPVGLEHPKTGKRAHAVIQFRQDNFARSLWNMVGFQTQMKWGEQKRILRQLPGMEKASFVRFGMIHRNTYVDSPRHLLPTYQFKKAPHVFLAGQITGVEGYVESAASGLVSGVLLARQLTGASVKSFPQTTALGALGHYVSFDGHQKLVPTNINFGLLGAVPMEGRVPKKIRKARLIERAKQDLAHFAQSLDEQLV